MSAAFAIFIEATVIASEAKQSMVLASKYGLLRRGAYHRSRVRATRVKPLSLTMTTVIKSPRVS
jgi:hypothetical protein